MRFHLLGLSHTKTTREYSCCAFTQKIRMLSRMLREAGQEVYHYGTEGSDPVCTENVTVLSDTCFRAVHGSEDWKRNGFNSNADTPSHRQFILNAIQEIKKRAQDGDFLLCTFGINHQQIARQFPNLIVVESGVGYEHTFAENRIFDSYAWMNYLYGKEQRIMNPPFYDAVIPNALDLADFPFSAEKDDYFVFLGRPIAGKGAKIASDVCEAIGAKLYIAGQGDPGTDIKAERLGVLSIEERGKWLSRAKALFCPTIYIEPFGLVAIEAMACGTPVICTDFGGFTETVQHGITGFRCRTFEQFVWAAQNIDWIYPDICRQRVERVYTPEAVIPMYEEYFQNLTRQRTEKGWYYIPVERVNCWVLR